MKPTNDNPNPTAPVDLPVRVLVAWLDARDTILPDDDTLIAVPATMLRDLRKWVDNNG